MPEVGENHGKQRHPVVLPKAGVQSYQKPLGWQTQLSDPDASERPLCPWLSRGFLPETSVSIAVMGPQAAEGREKPQENVTK